MPQVNHHLAAFKKTFTERFYRHIRLKLSVPVSWANATLITMFWEIGKELHAFVTKEQAVNKKLLLKSLAADLVRQYGSYLGADNLQYMQFFFETFPTASEIEDIQYQVSWEHILLLLKIEDKLLRRVYLQYSIAHHLSEADLRDAIKSEVHKTGVAGAQAKTPRRSGAVTALDRALASKAGLTNPFAASHFEAFRQLTEYPAAGEPTAEDEPAPERKEQLLYAAIEGLIERYRKRQLDQLNTQVNLAFFELGREIITENALDVDEAPPVGLLIWQTTEELERKFGLKIPKGMLQNMVDFAAVCKEGTLVSIVARFLTWQQIQVLLPFQSVSLINYYVNNFASNPLDIQGFKKRVNEEAAQVLASLPAPAAPENPFTLLVTIGKQSVKASNRTTLLSNIDYTNLADPQTIGNAIFSDSALIQFLALY